MRVPAPRDTPHIYPITHNRFYLHGKSLYQNWSQSPADFLSSAYRRIREVSFVAGFFTHFLYARPLQRCQPCARPHSAGSVPPAPPLTTPHLSHLQCTDILDIRLIIRTPEIIARSVYEAFGKPFII